MIPIVCWSRPHSSTLHLGRPPTARASSWVARVSEAMGRSGRASAAAAAARAEVPDDLASGA
eukprot:7877506-Pyramimonas_sp.AAC.1